MSAEFGSRIGMLTPSANTCLEPVSYAIVDKLPNVSVHFSRFKVTHTGLDQNALAQFEMRNLVEAARLLADAEMDVIAWNGSSGSWMPDGPAQDARLIDTIEAETNIPATTMTFAIWDAFEALGIKNFSLVTPFKDEMVQQIIANYGERGFTCVHSVNLPLPTTREKDRVPRSQMRRLIEAAAHPASGAIAVVCTNFRAAPLVEELENELGVPILDSVSATVWKTLRMIGVEPRIPAWGRLLRSEFAVRQC